MKQQSFTNTQTDLNLDKRNNLPLQQGLYILLHNNYISLKKNNTKKVRATRIDCVSLLGGGRVRDRKKKGEGSRGKKGGTERKQEQCVCVEGWGEGKEGDPATVGSNIPTTILFGGCHPLQPACQGIFLRHRIPTSPLQPQAKQYSWILAPVSPPSRGPEGAS